MNERIEELSLQCIRYKLIAEGARSDFDYKEFAELIVAECIDVVSDCSVEYCTRPQIVSEIREHFGVK